MAPPATAAAAASTVSVGLGFTFAAVSGIGLAIQSGLNATLGAHAGQAFAGITR